MSEKPPKVAIILPYHKGIHPVLNHLLLGGMTYPYLSLLLREDPESAKPPETPLEVYRRCSANREELRRKVLMDPKVEWVLSLDSDVLPPPDVVERLLHWTQEDTRGERSFDVMGGWIPLKGTTTIITQNDDGSEKHRETVQRYVAGVVMENGVFAHHTHPRTYKTTYSHIAPLGCCLIKRETLERIEFEPGCGEGQVIKEHPTGRLVPWGECLAFARRVYEQGGTVGLARDVICQHVNF